MCSGSCTRTASTPFTFVFANETATETTTKSEANTSEKIFLNIILPLTRRNSVRLETSFVWVVFEMICDQRKLPTGIAYWCSWQAPLASHGGGTPNKVWRRAPSE